MTRVLIVEDDKMIAGVLEYYLKEAEVYEVVCVQTAGEALALAREHFDVMLMDILLPDANGIDLCRHMRKWYTCPIIFISCLDDSDTIIKALEAGGDDFVTKPFNNKVLTARIEANLRRCESTFSSEDHSAVKCGGLTLYADERKVENNGSIVHLSATEFRLLDFLIQHKGKHFTPRELYRRVWDMPSGGDSRTVLVHIHNLRQKIETDPANPCFIVMEWGKGYTFCDGTKD